MDRNFYKLAAITHLGFREFIYYLHFLRQCFVSGGTLLRLRAKLLHYDTLLSCGKGLVQRINKFTTPLIVIDAFFRPLALEAHNLTKALACKYAKSYVFNCIKAAKKPSLGQDCGPIYHFYQLWNQLTNIMF